MHRLQIRRLLHLLFKRQALWRLGRFLYMEARADVPNQMETNGELIVQAELLNTFANQSDTLVVFDIGANIGDWAEYLIERCLRLDFESTPDIYLFEPIPTTFQYLSNRLQSYRDELSVVVERQALSNVNGSTQMYVYGESAGTNSLHQDIFGKNAQSVQVETVTLDTYCKEAQIDLIHYLKCDAEGHDAQVISGAKQLFALEKIKAFQFEYNHRWIFSRHYLKDIFDYFSGTRYRIGKITPKKVELFEYWHPELERFFEANYLIIHESALEWFPVKKGSFDGCNTYD